MIYNMPACILWNHQQSKDYLSSLGVQVPAHSVSWGWEEDASPTELFDLPVDYFFKIHPAVLFSALLAFNHCTHWIFLEEK